MARDEILARPIGKRGGDLHRCYDQLSLCMKVHFLVLVFQIYLSYILDKARSFGVGYQARRGQTNERYFNLEGRRL